MEKSTDTKPTQTAPQQKGPAVAVQEGSEQSPVSTSNKRGDTSGNGVLPMSLIKALRGKSSGENGSSSSNGGGSGNNSDNSALVSLGNTSFGFNFDSEEGIMNGSPQNSEEGDSDGNNGSSPFQSGNGTKQKAQAQPAPNPKPAVAGPTAGEASASANMRPVSVSSSHSEAAAAAVANLTSIASKYNGMYFEAVCVCFFDVLARRAT